MGRNAVTIGFSVPPETARLIDRIAQLEGRNRSELFRDMVRLYQQHHELEVFEELASYGRAKAEHRGVRTEEDVERLIAEARGES